MDIAEKNYVVGISAILSKDKSSACSLMANASALIAMREPKPAIGLTLNICGLLINLAWSRSRMMNDKARHDYMSMIKKLQRRCGGARIVLPHTKHHDQHFAVGNSP